ncbi:murein hydrolase activator EnvC family protein [Frigidibacter oleivorans]|uniref:murein hydrolase activator EnvC family protein n=1 Tax=Frigidibacter oleivorans TaxID=2487129 RepID=UPI001F3F438C|nr:peptidase M23 [Frigidibacter oleivorans]
MRRGLAVLCLVLSASALLAQDGGDLPEAAARGAPPRPISVAEDAASAAEGLRAAIDELQRAGSGREQAVALSRTIRAYEAGLADLRDGLRRAALREAEIAADLEARRARLSRLLGAMMVMQDSPAPLTLLHPEGPEAAVRAGMILSDVTPALQQEAAALSRSLREVAEIRRLQESAETLLSQGLAAAQEARATLNQAMADRGDLPRRFLEEPEELGRLRDSAETLDAFAGGIATMEQDIGAPMEDFEGARGTLPLPVLGTVLRRAGEADAAGIRRPGLVIATRPAALVTTPWPATLRYRGPLLDYGNVMILEPAEGYLLVLAGLGTVYGEVGDVLDAGAPVGLMGGAEPGGREFLAAVQEGGGADRSETLYLELRQGRETVDPAPWFSETRDD